jgi:predicted O-linked N-acetylglucosamine transferase (SPINDLY family)/predicted SAM-dependent methyltransferase
MFLDMLITDNNDAQENLTYCQLLILNGILVDDWESAQAALCMMVLNCESPEQEQLVYDSCIEFLHAQAKCQQSQDSSGNAHKISIFAQSIFPNNINVLLRLMVLELEIDRFSFAELEDREFLSLLDAADTEMIDQNAMHEAIEGILHSFDALQSQLLPNGFILDLVSTFLDKSLDRYRSMSMLVVKAFALGERHHLKDLRAEILQICLNSCELGCSWRFQILVQTTSAMASAGQYDRAILLAERCCEESSGCSQEDKVIASGQLLSALMEAGRWMLISEAAQRHQLNLHALIQSEPLILNCSPMIVSSYFLNYMCDDARTLHGLRNSVGKICATSIQKRLGRVVHDPELAEKSKVLKIGYIASTLRQHSVGWLSRWLFNYHDRQDFQVFIYNVSHSSEDAFYRRHFESKADFSYSFGADVAEIVQQIERDEIDILVDMDSLSLSTTYEVMCCKPAPIQVTWLGWDTSGCPEIDYFIADPYVVPEDAQDYYHSKIWRLPQTYLAVDGFETAAPTQRRTDYDIPEDGIVYLCGQKSYKHNPGILRLQLQIIREVPNSYLFVKLLGDRDSLINTYRQVAEEVGISMNQLRFLDRDSDEYTHRANLGIADVVLDTFPYNGATTTLETLWAGVPMVTKVGQAFVARNSYAFMMNVGLTEGIAHSDEEYVAWGVKLGTDPVLRQQVSGKLLQSRKTSPLWNAKQFTSEMENAYRQMWEIYQKSLQAKGDEGVNTQAFLTEPIRLHIGGQVAHPDWKIFDALPRPEVDFLGNAKDLSQFADGSIAAIYASHVLEHFYYLLDNELLLTLKEWHRSLQPSGELMISVPNLQVICGLYADSHTPPNARHHLMRMIFGGQIDQYDVHKVGFDPDTLGMYLQQAGFRSVQVVPAFGLFPDCSSLEFAGVPISLNMIAKK